LRRRIEDGVDADAAATESELQQLAAKVGR
jgi:hypothetical protein